MQFGPIFVALAGIGIGLGLCTYSLTHLARSEGLGAASLRTAVGYTLFLTAILAYVQLGFGALFGGDWQSLLSIDTDVKARRSWFLPAIWAGLAASLELFVVSTWLALRKLP